MTNERLVRLKTQLQIGFVTLNIAEALFRIARQLFTEREDPSAGAYELHELGTGHALRFDPETGNTWDLDFTHHYWQPIITEWATSETRGGDNESSHTSYREMLSKLQ